MTKAEEFGFIKQAQSELNQRITQTTKICEQFKKSYSGYSSIVKQIVLLALLAIPISMLIWALLNINVIITFFSAQNYDRDALLLKISLAGIALYIALHIYRRVMHILRISKINGHVFTVRNIEKRLQKNLSNLGNIAAEADKQIYGSANVKIDPKDDVDAEIAKYSSMAKIYSNPDDNVLSVALTVMHWLSGIVFAGVFILISTPFFTEKIGEWIKIKENGLISSDLISYTYIAVFIIAFMIFQELFAKKNIDDIHIKIKNVIGVLLIIGICGLLGYMLFGQGRGYLFDNSMQVHQFEDKEYTFASILSGFIEEQTSFNYYGYIRSLSMPYIPLVICVVFLSIICLICKFNKLILNIIGIIFSVAVLGILLFLIFGLKFISFFIFLDKISDTLSVNVFSYFLIAFVPLMTATFFASIISIFCRIKSAVFGSIVVACGLLYTFVFFFIFLHSYGKIQYALIGDIITWAIVLGILFISTIGAILPSLSILLISTPISKVIQKYALDDYDDDDKYLFLGSSAIVFNGFLGFLLGFLIGAITAPVLYALAGIIELLACFFTCGQRGIGCGQKNIIPIWNGVYFSNTVLFCVIAISIIGAIYKTAKYIQEN